MQTFAGAITWSADCMTATLPIVVMPIQGVEIERIPEESPCFTSSATVTLADGTHAPIDALKEVYGSRSALRS